MEAGFTPPFQAFHTAADKIAVPSMCRQLLWGREVRYMSIDCLLFVKLIQNCHPDQIGPFIGLIDGLIKIPKLDKVKDLTAKLTGNKELLGECLRFYLKKVSNHTDEVIFTKIPKIFSTSDDSSSDPTNDETTELRTIRAIKEAVLAKAIGKAAPLAVKVMEKFLTPSLRRAESREAPTQDLFLKLEKSAPGAPSCGAGSGAGGGAGGGGSACAAKEAEPERTLKPKVDSDCSTVLCASSNPEIDEFLMEYDATITCLSEDSSDDEDVVQGNRYFEFFKGTRSLSKSDPEINNVFIEVKRYKLTELLEFMNSATQRVVVTDKYRKISESQRVILNLAGLEEDQSELPSNERYPLLHLACEILKEMDFISQKELICDFRRLKKEAFARKKTDPYCRIIKHQRSLQRVIKSKEYKDMILHSDSRFLTEEKKALLTAAIKENERLIKNISKKISKIKNRMETLAPR